MGRISEAPAPAQDVYGRPGVEFIRLVVAYMHTKDRQGELSLTVFLSLQVINEPLSMMDCLYSGGEDK